MNWEAIGALGEVGGAVAVVLTLVFLILQIRQHTRAINSEATFNATAVMQGFFLNLGSNEQTPANWVQGMTEPDSLSAPSRLQFYAQIQAAMLGFQQAFLLESRGALDTHLKDALVTMMLTVKDQPGFHQFWAERSQIFDKLFREYVDDLLQNNEIDVPVSRVYQRH